jgi:hypothetical protein
VIEFRDQAAVVELLEQLPDHVARADAEFQIRQQLAWQAFGAGHPLLEGHDRAANLGIESVSITLALVAEPPSFWRRLLAHLFPRLLATSRRLRLVAADDEHFTLRVTAVIRRDARGVFRATIE